MNFISELFSVNVAHAGIDSFIAKVNDNILNPIIYFLFAVAFVVFLYGVVIFIANQENETERSTGKKHMLFGIVGLAIMFSVWALIKLVTSTLKLEDDVTPGSSTVGGSVHLQDFEVNLPPVGPN